MQPSRGRATCRYERSNLLDLPGAQQRDVLPLPRARSSATIQTMLPPLSPGRMVSRDYRFQRMALALAGLRILVGFLWLSNLLWKLPPDFGRDEPRGFHHYLEVASQHAIGPLQDLTTSVLLPHDTASGWLVFAVELTAGVLFLLGYRIQIAALLGTGQAVAIAALVGLAPGEWRWGYLMLIALNAVPLIAPTTLRLSVDAALGRV